MPLVLSSEAFVSALIGALVGGVFAMGGTWLADWLERRRHGWAEALAVHAELGEWWRAAKGRFAQARATLERLAESPAEEAGIKIDEIVEELLDAIPPTLEIRLYIYGNENVYRRFSEGRGHLESLSLALLPLRYPRLEGQTPESRRDAEVTVLTAAQLVGNAVLRFEQAMFAVKVVEGQIRRRIRGHARLKPEKLP